MQDHDQICSAARYLSEESITLSIGLVGNTYLLNL